MRTDVNHDFDLRWKEAITKLEQIFGEDIDLQAAIFLIGTRELGKGPKKFTKDEKMNIMHLGVCRLLAPYGYYELEGLDQDEWPHYRRIKRLPLLNSAQQDRFMKEAVIEYICSEI